MDPIKEKVTKQSMIHTLFHSFLSQRRSLHVLGAMLLLFISSSPASLAQTAKDSKTAIAIVNGSVIPYQWYVEDRTDRLQRRGLSAIDTTYISQLEDDELFLTLIDAELTRQEGEKRGIVVKEKEGKAALLNDPPEYIRSIFLNEKGVFQKKRLRDAINTPKNIAKYVYNPEAPGEKQQLINAWRSDVEQLIRYYQYAERREQLKEYLYNQSPLSDNNIEHRYFAEKTVLNGSILRVLHSTIPDSLAPVTEEEAKQWYAKHKEEYRIAPSRHISAAIVQVIPSSVDSSLVRARIDALRDVIENTSERERLASVDKAITTLLPNRIPVDQFISLGRMPKEIRQDLAHGSKGELFGPYPVEREFLLLYMADTEPTTDTLVRARHILLKVPTGDTSNYESQVRLFAEKLRDSIKDEKTFIEAVRYFSEDKVNKANGGDLGYGGRGLFVPEFEDAIFSGEEGKLIGPVKTRFGFHLIWVIDKIDRNFKLRELRFPIVPSESVRENIRADLKNFSSSLQSGVNTDSAIKVLNQKYPKLILDTAWVKQLEPYGDALAPSEFAFKAEVGDATVVDLPFDRMAAIKVIDFWIGGVPPYEAIPIYPFSHVRRKKQLDLLRPKAEMAIGSLSSDPAMLVGEVRRFLPGAEAFVMNDEGIIHLPDESKTMLDSLVAVTETGEVSGPVQGIHGYYYLRVKKRYGPNKPQYERERETFHANYLHRYKEELLEEVLLEARSNAEINDLRPGKTRS